MVHFNKPQYPTIVAKKKDIPKGVWVKCPLSGEIVFNKDLEANQMVVPKSGYHFRLGARERLKNLLDPDTFQELAAENFAENALRKKEAGISRAHPAGVIARQATGGHDAVSVGMMLQLLIPGV